MLNCVKNQTKRYRYRFDVIHIWRPVFKYLKPVSEFILKRQSMHEQIKIQKVLNIFQNK